MSVLLAIDPNLVRPGWTPLLILIALALVVVGLAFSMRRQFRKINVPGDPRRPADGGRPTPSQD